jgi:hypothetical protein
MIYLNIWDTEGDARVLVRLFLFDLAWLEFHKSGLKLEKGTSLRCPSSNSLFLTFNLRGSDFSYIKTGNGTIHRDSIGVSPATPIRFMFFLAVSSSSSS